MSINITIYCYARSCFPYTFLSLPLCASPFSLSFFLSSSVSFLISLSLSLLFCSHFLLFLLSLSFSLHPLFNFILTLIPSLPLFLTLYSLSYSFFVDHSSPSSHSFHSLFPHSLFSLFLSLALSPSITPLKSLSLSLSLSLSFLLFFVSLSFYFVGLSFLIFSSLLSPTNILSCSLLLSFTPSHFLSLTSPFLSPSLSPSLYYISPLLLSLFLTLFSLSLSLFPLILPLYLHLYLTLLSQFLSNSLSFYRSLPLFNLSHFSSPLLTLCPNRSLSLAPFSITLSSLYIFHSISPRPRSLNLFNFSDFLPLSLPFSFAMLLSHIILSSLYY